MKKLLRLPDTGQLPENRKFQGGNHDELLRYGYGIYGTAGAVCVS